jgi:5-methylcytosine-specific restriction endonuclease McrBC GTP-binding regulatory subunit McrB
MPIAALWSLVISLSLLALGMAYKLAELGHSLKKVNEDADGLRKKLSSFEESAKNESLCFRAEIDSLKETHNKEISDIKELHQRETEKLRKEIDKLSHIEIAPDTAVVLPNEQVGILKTIYKQDNQQIENLAQSLQIEVQLAKFHVVELLTNGMVKNKRIYRPEITQSRWGTTTHQIPVSVITIGQNGRKYLIDNGMV